MSIRFLFGVFCAMALTACTPTQQPIQFGIDSCSFCKMTIVDRQHAAEIVTRKGRAYKYDAIECMLNDRTHDTDDVAMYLVMDFNDPGTFIDAGKATYLISENIPSPMGAFLSAFRTGDAAKEVQKTETGDLLTWRGLREQFAEKK